MPAVIPFIPLIAAGVGAAGSAISGAKNRSAADRARESALSQVAAGEKEQGDYRDYIAQLLGIPGAGADAGTGGGGSGLFASMAAPQVTTQTGEQFVNQLMSPEFSAAAAPYAEMLTKRYAGDVARGTALPPGYAERQVANIQASAAPQLQAEEDLARSRGISPSVAMIGSPTRRAVSGQIADFRANLPLMEDQLMQQKQSQLANWITTTALGQRTKGRTSTTGTTTGPANYAALLGAVDRLKPADKTIIT